MGKYILDYSNVNPELSQDTKYADLSEEELIDCFQPEAWKEICRDEREMLRVLQEVGNRYAEGHGIEERPVIERVSDPKVYGSYSYGRNVITINLDEAKKNPMEALDTVVHEENHALQYQCMDYGSDTTTSFTKEEIALLKAETEAYVNDEPRYHRQSLEVDSNNAGLRFVLYCKDRFINTPEFEEYINKRDEFYQLLGDEYEDEPEKVRMSEYLQVLKAYSSGKLTVDEAEDAKRCLQTKNSIRMETEYLRGQLQEIKQDMEVQNEVQKLEDGLDFLEEEIGSAEDIQETVEVLEVQENEAVNEYSME